MCDEDLFLELVWLPKASELPEVNALFERKAVEKKLKLSGPLLKLKTSLSSWVGFSLFLTDFKPRIEFSNDSSEQVQKRSKAENALFYVEHLYDVSCTVKVESNLLRDLQLLIERFCCIPRSAEFLPELWLKFHSGSVSEKAIVTIDNYLVINKFCLGNLPGLNTFVERFNSEDSLQSVSYKVTQIRVKFLHDYKKMQLFFVVGKDLPTKQRNASTHHMHKLEIHYSSLNYVLISKNNQLTVYIHMLLPPLLYAVEHHEDDEEYTSFNDLSPKSKWFRAVDLFKGAPLYLRKEFTMNRVLRLDFKVQSYDTLVQLMYHNKNIKIFYAPVNVFQNKVNEVKLQTSNFEVFYAVQCILTLSFEVVDQLSVQKELGKFIQYIKEKSKENPGAFAEALYVIYDALCKGCMFRFSYCVNILYERLCKNVPEINSDDSKEDNIASKVKYESSLLLIKRAVYTPTRCLLLPPQPILKNRALRMCEPEFSLRVSVKDENFKNLNFTLYQGGVFNKDKRLQNFFQVYFKNPMLKGLSIEKRDYNYVGSSTSQLKGHGMWFYATDTSKRTARDIRREFGDMEKIKQVPKYMARMGQTFSQAMGHVIVPQEFTNINNPEKDIVGGIKQFMSDIDSETERRNDKFLVEKLRVKSGDSKSEKKEDKLLVESGDKKDEVEDEEPYVFSDGVGRISLEIADEIYKEFDIEETRPSAMQIRYAGCKGMLVVDPKLEGKRIVFRESMKKYSSKTDTSLEILKFSEKRSAELNRPLVTILEQLGVPKETFLKLQKEMIQNNIKSMFHENEACDFLNRNALARFNFIEMHRQGICFTEDPLFRSMIYALFQKKIDLLKTKANIELSPDKARSMFGVVDETFTLKYGEVFVQYSDWDTDKPKIVTGTVVVTKNPCMHPGDVRKFQAIDVKDLHHIVDCIVFPAQGKRPHPDEMAGSDLDGDEYHVMWIDGLIFPKENYEPMHYAQRKDKSQDLPRPITEADELDHLCQFIFNDKVGLIASAHLACADSFHSGIFSQTCIRLAKCYSIALDFAKSGKIATRHKSDKPFRYPDFMQKLDENKVTYLSNSALGQLYRNCKRLELGLETGRNEVSYKLDPDLIHESWGKYKSSALKVLKRYSERIEYFLRTYMFESEGQLLAGAIINPPKYYENKHDFSNLMALIEYEVQYIFKDLERKFFQEFGGKPKERKYTNEMRQKASAWYMASYNKIAEKHCYFFGLPWAVADVLVDLKFKKRKKEMGFRVQFNSKSYLEDVVDKSISKHMEFLTLSPETEASIIYDNRIAVLDASYEVLEKWLKSQKEYFTETNVRLIRKCITKEYQDVTARILSCDDRYIEHLKQAGGIRKAISPCYNIIETMLRVANIGVQTPQIQLSYIHQEVGLLSWITLIKLACTYNPQYLGIPSESGNNANSVLYKSQNDIIETVQLPLYDHSNEANEKFSNLIIHNEDSVKSYLLEQTKLKNIEFRTVPERDNRFYVKCTLEGTRYAIEKLKSIIVMDHFFTCVVENKPLSYSA